MTKIKRFISDGNIYFLTHVTHNRDPILIENIDLLNQSVQSLQTNKKFNVIAWVVLPDHFHLIIDPMNDDWGVNDNLKFKGEFGE